MKRFRAAFLAVLMMCGMPAAAQEIMDFNQTWVGPEDYYNSSGARLSDPCAIIRQERANFHRFGIRHPSDESDSIFGDPTNRAAMDGRCRFRSSGGWVLDHFRRGDPVYIRVHIMGRGNRLTHVEIMEGAG